MIKISLNTLLFNCLFAGYIVAVFLYHIIEDTWNFTYTDEILSLVLFSIYYIYVNKNERINKEFFFLLCIFTFYTIYSCLIRVTSFNGIIMDALIQIKSYIAFYIVYSLKCKCTIKQKKKLKYLVMAAIPILAFIGIAGDEMQGAIFGHNSRYATTICITGFIYLYCSKREKKDVIITLCIWALGILSGRSKFYGFYALAVFLFGFMHLTYKTKLYSLKSLFTLLIISGIIFIIAKEKILAYLIDGTQGEEMWARPALYAGTISVLKEYFLLGSGFGTYGTWASGVYYSPLYQRFGLDNVEGISPDYYDFIADTFYPSLVQYGVIGIGLFILFWKTLICKSNQILKQNNDAILYKMCILVIGFFFIESFTDSTFTNNRGLYMMMLLGVFLSEHQQPKKQLQNENSTNRRLPL